MREMKSRLLKKLKSHMLKNDTYKPYQILVTILILQRLLEGDRHIFHMKFYQES